MNFRRYAVYYAPPAGSEFARFGASWLGWDADAGREIPHPESTVDVGAITASPRKYGFHGTLRPPFALQGSAADLLAAVEEAALAHGRIVTPPLRLSRLGPFLALTLSELSAELNALAATCVAELDPFRAPTTQAVVAKRRARGLSGRQERLLERWGYPYVMEEFRFHLTLSGALSAETLAMAEDALAPLIAPFLTPVEISEIAVFGEAEDGRFHIVRRFALRG